MVFMDSLLLVAVGDSASGEVIRRQFEGDPVASHNFDPISAQFPSHAGQHRFACVELDGKHSGPEFLDNFAHDFNAVFF